MFHASLLLVGIVGWASAATATSDATAGSPGTAPTMPATSVMVGDPNCKDNLTTCISYEHASCTGPYEDWARVHCAATCGFCIPITSPFDCVDMNPLCSSMNSDLCTNPIYTGFVRSNCLKFCNWCPGGVTTTKIPKTGCYDDFENCGEFGRKTCVDYPEWSDTYCQKYCGFCTSNTIEASIPMSTTTTPAPTPSHAPGDCYDRIDCSSYDIHVSCCESYERWARWNCAATCKFCKLKNTTPRMCTDNSPICSQYNSDLCTNPIYTHFAATECAGFCKICLEHEYTPPCAANTTTTPAPVSVSVGMEKASIPMSTTTTPAPTPSHAPGDCYDRIDCSSYDIHVSCCESYERWARWNCAATCKFCKLKNTTPRMCTDNSPICSQYNSDLCTNPIYTHFAATECAGFCKICLEHEYTPPCAANTTTTPAPVSVSVGMEKASIPMSTTTTPAPTPSHAPGCIQDGVYHREGDRWDSLGCESTYQCVDAASNNITSKPLWCVREVPKDCYFVLKIGACCPLIRCEYPNIIHGERTQEHGYILG